MTRNLRDIDFLQHIETAIRKILAYTDGKSEQQFLADSVVQDATIRNFEIIGEAVNRLSDSLKDANPGIEWRKINGMRNRLIHGYFDIDLATVFDTVETALPDLLTKIAALRQSLETGTDGQSTRRNE